jgi:superfamily II DNA or RNA helicase
VDALYELKQAWDEGVEKGLVIAATGIGKTYLEAFDSIQYKHILFLAHRKEILQQAEASFKKIRPGAVTGFYTGQVKDEGAAVYFATVQTLARERHLRMFASDYFDYIVVDEFHHAAAGSYQAVINYFRPRFLLGLTATPYRTDNRDIYAICDDNVILDWICG